MDKDGIGMEVGLGPFHIVLDGDLPLPHPKKMGAQPPAQFSAHVCCGQTAGWIKMPLSTEVGLGPGDSVLNGDPAPLERGTASPHFSAHVYCGDMAGWIKMPLNTEVDLGPGHIVIDGAQLRQKRAQQPPLFDPCLSWPNGRPSQLLLSACYTTEKLT